MMSADHSHIPFALPTEDDLGINLGQGERSHYALGHRRYPLQPGILLFLWLFASAMLAITAVYHVIADGPGARLLSWTASAGAVALLLGALILKQRRWTLPRSALALEVSAGLLLTAFVLPTAQLLLTLVISQDLGYTAYVMLLVIGYSLLAGSTEALLLYVTITLAAWSACALRCPTGVWIGYVLPWAGTVGMSLFIHTRLQRITAPPVTKRPLSSSSVIDVNLEEPLRLAITERDRAQHVARQLDQELTALRQAYHDHVDFLPVIQDLNQQLSQDVTLQEVGPRWLERLISPLRAEYAAIWLKEKDQEPRLAVSTSVTASSDEVLVSEVFQAGTLLQRGSQWGIPLDFGLHGRGVLIAQGVSRVDAVQVERLLRAASAHLSVFIRWQLAEAKGDSMAHDVLQHRDRSQLLQQELVTQQQASAQLHDHLHKQWEKAEQELAAIQNHSSNSQSQIAHWKAESERYQKLVETAQTEHDMLTQLLDEAEIELKKLQSIPSSNEAIKDYEIKLKTAEATAEAARSHLHKLEQRFQASEAERKSLEADCDTAGKEVEAIRTALAKAETEAREAHAEWERETELVNRLSAGFKALTDAVAIFDASGKVIVENDAARQLRGTTRNLAGEHPLYQQLITKDRSGQKKPWTLDCTLAGSEYHASITPLQHQTQLDGYVIVASAKHVVEMPRPDASEEESRLVGPRFFGSLAQTLEPPLSQLIDHADALLDANSDQDVRRQALMGILQQGRHVRRLLTQAIDYAQLEAGQAAIVKSPVSLWQLLQQVGNQLRPSAEEKGLELVLQPSGTLPASITSDPQRLTNLLQQLISQSIRATSTGMVAIKVGLDQQKVSQYTAGKLRIEMNGEARHNSNTFAADFAMNLAKKQAALLHAELIQQPSTTSLLLPVTSSEMLHLLPMDKLKIDEDALPEGAFTQSLNGKVLVVCDGQEQQRVATYQLERLGLRCEVLADAEQALARASEDRFDLVLWDTAKRDLPLVKASQHLRSQFYQGAILAMGPLISPSQREDFLAAGGDGFLSRPIVLATWRHIINSFLPDGNSSMHSGGESMTSDFHADRDFLNLIRGYVAKLPSQVAEMRAALQVADIARLIRMAHALVDGGQLYGYPTLSDYAQQLEKALIQGRDTPLLTQLVDQLSQAVLKIERGIKQPRSAGYLSLPGPLTRAA